jgi:Zn-dependent M28 family amino/carboxypeptidase
MEVFREIQPGALRLAPDPAIASVLERLSVLTFRSALEELVGLHTRLSTSASYGQAAELCRARLTDMGYAARLQEFDMPGGRSSNVVALPRGAARATVLVMGHLDSVNHDGGPAAQAPGADDNASGSAGVIAMAEALLPVTERLPVGFVLFGGEEQGLLGSIHLLATLSNEDRAALRAVINMDMIGTKNVLPDGTPVAPGVLLEGKEVSRAVVEGLAAQAATWTDLAVETSFNPFASDHVPFIEAGLPGVLTIEGADRANTAVHGPGDTLDRIDDGLAYRILRMNTAYVASLAAAD